jgi:exopolysaccharide biosynthesis polyprenyl glycosylphosphotransferase
MSHRVVIVGTENHIRNALQRLEGYAWRDVAVLGYVTDDDALQDSALQKLGCLHSIEDIILFYRVTDVLLALPSDSRPETHQLIGKIMSKPCNVWVVPDYFKLLIASARADNLNGVPMLSLTKPVMTQTERSIKRVFDFIAASALIPLLFPVMAVIALIIKYDSPGPVLFKQKRVGENGKLFEIFKFRSMAADASEKQERGEDMPKEGYLKRPNDPRVTKVGKFIRHTSIDELPNLFNVWLGQMSLVGPRPELPHFVERYQPWQHRRLIVPQGMTGWWQINGRSDKPLHLHTEDDIYYVQNYSLWLDVRILIRTAWVVIMGKGAY